MRFNSKNRKEAVLNLAKAINRETEDLLANLEEGNVDEAEEIMDILNDDCDSLTLNLVQLISEHRTDG